MSVDFEGAGKFPSLTFWHLGIEHLDGLPHLAFLDLYDNKIQNIENLDSWTCMFTAWKDVKG